MSFPQPAERSVDRERAECSAKGGALRFYGRGGTRSFCELPFADAGKVCAAKADCTGECTLPDNYVPVAGQAFLKRGTCQAPVRMGCIRVLRDSLPTKVCID